MNLTAILGICIISAVTATLLTKKPSAEIEAIYETATNPELED